MSIFSWENVGKMTWKNSIKNRIKQNRFLPKEMDVFFILNVKTHMWVREYPIFYNPHFSSNLLTSSEGLVNALTGHFTSAETNILYHIMLKPTSNPLNSLSCAYFFLPLGTVQKHMLITTICCFS